MKELSHMTSLIVSRLSLPMHRADSGEADRLAVSLQLGRFVGPCRQGYPIVDLLALQHVYPVPAATKDVCLGS